MSKVNTALCFDDVQLVDGFCGLSSRSNVSLVQEHGKCYSDFTFSNSVIGYNTDLPVIAAAMDTVTSVDLAVELIKYGGGVVHHRGESMYERIKKVGETHARIAEEHKNNNMKYRQGINGVAVGMGEDANDIRCLIASGANLVSLEVASAFNHFIIERARFLSSICDEKNVLFCMGNFSNPKIVYYIKDFIKNVDFLKVSQGGGSACTTRVETGIGKPTFQAVVDLREELDSLSEMDHIQRDKLPKIIADGGIKKNGDIVKSIGAGASLCMLGGMLAGHDECPTDGKFRGMASVEAKDDSYNVEQIKNAEGESGKIKTKGSVVDTLKHMKECIQSGVATSGFDSVSDFIGKGNFIRVTRAGQVEATPHAF